MLVVVPFTVLQTETKEALDASGYAWEARFVGESDTAYWELLSELWNGGETFAIVEHDVVPNTDSLYWLDQCPQPWCAAPYSYFAGMYAGLGCARFRSELLRATPGLMNEVATMYNAHHPPKHWCSLDAFIRARLIPRGYVIPHVHDAVKHLSDGEPTHGCRAA